MERRLVLAPSPDKAARTAIAVDLIESAGWEEIVLPLLWNITRKAYGTLLGQGDADESKEAAGTIKGFRALVKGVYTDAEHTVPERFKPFFD